MLDGLTLTILDTNNSICIYQTRPARPSRKPRLISEAEKAWRDCKPFLKEPDEPGTAIRTPYGFTEPWHKMTFRDELHELMWLETSQRLELAAQDHELRSNDIPSFSLSSSFSDDETIDARVLVNQKDDDIVAGDSENERNARRYGVSMKYDPETLAPILRRIEWEKYILACSQSVRIFVDTTGGKRLPATNDQRHTPEEVNGFATLLTERLGFLPSAEDIDLARERAAHYKKIVWSLMSPEEHHDWSHHGPAYNRYMAPLQQGARIEEAWPEMRDKTNAQDPLAIVWVDDPDEPGYLVTEAAPDPQPTGAPVELGLHWLTTDLPDELFDSETRVLPEPNELEFWPVDAGLWWMD